ncbi:uncharacterized protein CELE_C49G9.2 [Caenorhabditis elegans]|uniref:Uncharacterized protein n=1 Tax=Caenorhabditis elegans TaxID=6239 RepID=A5PEW9_CAEEL|nr:Uncharacterized protein CELE_C49G9.2 [Caenorhabditis elegans]CAN99662.1 Uncharacterized protein CELE_C49G9.2 [Caenorhabditis elegans]|eukprot:NP_001122435.1 Uncharacterized protein CELE_C49G9.2 [Caenorhabditis elegans]
MQQFEGWLQIKQFGIFFLGVVVGSFCTIILFFYGCFKSSTLSAKPTESSGDSGNSEDIESQETQRPPAYSSLKFDKKPNTCKCCRVLSTKLNSKNVSKK